MRPKAKIQYKRVQGSRKLLTLISNKKAKRCDKLRVKYTISEFNKITTRNISLQVIKTDRSINYEARCNEIRNKLNFNRGLFTAT